VLPAGPAQVLALQRSAGNAAVTRALGRPMLLRDPQSDAVEEAIRSAPGGEYERAHVGDRRDRPAHARGRDAAHDVHEVSARAQRRRFSNQ
jgi:hypothetical protein